MTSRPTEASDQPREEINGTTSTSLIGRVKAHDEEACRRLVELYGPLVYCWCRRFEVKPEDVADLVQEVFRAAFRGIDGFRHDRPTDTFRGWLWTITSNKVRDHFNRRAAQPVAFGGTDAKQRFLEIAADGSLSSDEPGPLAGLLHRAMTLIQNEFEEQTWQAFWLATVEQQSSVDVAGRLRMTPGAVRQAKYKVLRRLRQELGDVP
jgi:RNA polymerase sigma-70 factor (ECF subfamily)